MPPNPTVDVALVSRGLTTLVRSPERSCQLPGAEAAAPPAELGLGFSFSSELAAGLGSCLHPALPRCPLLCRGLMLAH